MALDIVNAYVKHDALAKAFLGRHPAENGVPKHIIEIKVRAAQTSAMTVR